MKALQSFLAALVTFTRIPIARHLPADAFSRASLQLPVLGWMLGAGQYAILFVASHWIAHDVALFLALVFPVLLSGGMHEDGLADFADGMLGGQSVAQRLEIMKDPRVGTYGVLALLVILGGGFLALRATALEHQGRLLIISAVFSRAICIPLLGTLPYLNHAGSRSQSFIPENFYGWRMLLALWPMIPVLAFMPSAATSLACLLLFAQMFFMIRRYLMKKLEGLTGDCLGAAIKMTEFVFYFLGCIIWPQMAGI